MVIHIVIAGESDCVMFAEICLVADYLSQNLPNFCYERIEKSVLEWETWLAKINMKNKWHHSGSPLVWKELLMKGSKPYYIGGASEFLEYCHSYYEIKAFLTPEKFDGLTANFKQFKQKLQHEKFNVRDIRSEEEKSEMDFTVTISGVANPLTMFLISGLMEMSTGIKSISKIYIYDENCSPEFLESLERECSYIQSDQYIKVVKYIEKIGAGLTCTDLLIVLDHVPFQNHMAIGEWLHMNRRVMCRLALHINASAARNMYVLLPNLGPACYNATILSDQVNINKNNIVVATSDLGLEIAATAAEMAEISLRNMFCPPVWGFVGINHLVDIRTTVHKYETFEPYKRYTKVRNSSLVIGSVTPELRTMEYLMYFNDTLWQKVAENKANTRNVFHIHKVVAVLDVVKQWLFERDPKNIINLGVLCNGSFNLSIHAVFSQPARFFNGYWTPASEYLLPKDPQMNLDYLQKMTKLVFELDKTALPKIISYYPCSCKTILKGKKHVW